MSKEFDPRVIGTGGLSPWIAFSSSPRLQMFTNQIGQSLVPKGASPRRCMSMLEREYAKTTFSIKMPCNGRILKIIPRYRIQYGYDTIRENPEDFILFEDTEKKEIGVVVVPRYHSLHQLFGFRYVLTEVFNNLTPGQYVKRDTVFAHSPSVSDQGDLMYGVEANVVIGSFPGTIEDGVIFSRSFSKKMGITTYSKRIFKLSKGSFLLNVYGDDVKYKGLPDIGEIVGEDGLLGAVREFEDYMSVANMNKRALRNPTMFDRSQYVQPGSRVIDIKILSDKQTRPMVPVGMTDQLDKYLNSQDQFNRDMIGEYIKLKQKYRGHVPLSHELFKLMMDTYANLDDGKVTRNRVTRLHRMTPLEEYRIEVVVEHHMDANITFKTAGTFGD